MTIDFPLKPQRSIIKHCEEKVIVKTKNILEIMMFSISNSNGWVATAARVYQ